MRVLFMGTPDFARIVLESLIDDFEIVGVVTQPDKPVGRKQTITPSPVKIFALEHNIKVYQPQSLRGDDFAALLAEINPDILVVAAYGKILPKNIIEHPKCGCVVIHASLLPEYRGAAPINAAIMDGAKVTGITIIYADEGIDTGDMILKGELEIGTDENFGELSIRLAELGGRLILQALEQIQTGTAKRVKQPELGVSYVGKIDTKTCEIDWSMTAQQVHDKIRGLAPQPTAYTWLNGKKLKLYKSRINPHHGDGSLGEVLNATKIIEVKTGDQCIELLELQLEGEKKMSASDFINGRKIAKGMILGK